MDFYSLWFPSRGKSSRIKIIHMLLTTTKNYGLCAGMPSTHSMVGLAVPATVVYVTTGKYEYSLLLGIVFSWYSPLFLSFFYCIDNFFASMGLLRRGIGRQVKSRLCWITTGSSWEISTFQITPAILFFLTFFSAYIGNNFEKTFMKIVQFHCSTCCKC